VASKNMPFVCMQVCFDREARWRSARGLRLPALLNMNGRYLRYIKPRVSHSISRWCKVARLVPAARADIKAGHLCCDQERVQDVV
jgi:hypothetical protein